MKHLYFLLITVVLLSSCVAPLNLGENFQTLKGNYINGDIQTKALTFQVVDVGAGFCGIVSAPDKNGGRRYLMFDTGKNLNGFNKLKEFLPSKELDYLVISHPDYDHFRYAQRIVDSFDVKTVIRSGYIRIDTVNSWLDYHNFFDTVQTIKTHINQNASVSLSSIDRVAEIGETFELGDATITLISGFGDEYPWKDEITLPANELRNAISIVLRIDYAGKSILLTGDEIGVHSGDGSHAIATEKFMLEGNASIDADVLVASHHGGNNASSTPFLEKVSPSVVIFPSGNDYGHPREAVVTRMQSISSVKEIYRTDYGSSEGGEEWTFGNGSGDSSGDDDVLIVIDSSGKLYSGYMKDGNEVWNLDDL